MAFARPERRELARLSAKSFLAQTWPRKELVVFNATQRPLFFPPRRTIREIRLRQRPLDRMLDLCLENSNGIWCAIWWDDCVYHRDYLRVMLAKAVPGGLVRLRNKLIFDKSLNAVCSTDTERIACALFPRSRPVVFDRDLAEQFRQVVTFDGPANLVVKVARLLHE